MTAATTEHPDVPCGTSWIHTPYSCPPLRINLLRPVEKPISYEHDLALSHIHPHPHRENVWKYPLFPARPFGRCRLARLPHQTHIAYDACIPSQNNDLRFYNRNFANGDFGADEEFCNPWCMTHKQAVFFMRRAGHARPLHGRQLFILSAQWWCPLRRRQRPRRPGPRRRRGRPRRSCSCCRAGCPRCNSPHCRRWR